MQVQNSELCGRLSTFSHSFVHSFMHSPLSFTGALGQSWCGGAHQSTAGSVATVHTQGSWVSTPPEGGQRGGCDVAAESWGTGWQVVEREVQGRSSVYALRMVESDDMETGQEGSEHRGAPDGLRGQEDCRLEGGMTWARHPGLKPPQEPKRGSRRWSWGGGKEQIWGILRKQSQEHVVGCRGGGARVTPGPIGSFPHAPGLPTGSFLHMGLSHCHWHCTPTYY